MRRRKISPRRPQRSTHAASRRRMRPLAVPMDFIRVPT